MPGTGNCFEKSITCFLSCSIFEWKSTSSIKGINFNAWSIKSTILRTSSSFTHLVVIAGVHILSPDGLNGGFGSSGIVD